ncbi:hypothetical protein ABB30_13980 [Stenotrophomonas ginsengisoli]|uniref:Transmembrane protein n=1 Tax=Stenotrophomonas ginsengisoli TaxID=336566 RepID=A0A0R0D8C2_9GAMM|nr:hypothetical protein [Stenotrophomonas ginsengisoli]KRG74407.1 hypothetical protein ABB30_13980 [Stenotrophomonas ginsengisoli]
MRNPQFYFNNLRAVFAPRKPRNPLVRVGLGLVGLVILAGLLVVGLFVGAAMLLVGLVLKLFNPRRSTGTARSNTGRHDNNVVDAQYTVVSRQAIDAPR